MPDHSCRYRSRVVWSEWTPTGTLRERIARRVPTCETCGREQPARRLRLPFLREEEAAVREPISLLDGAGRAVAESLARRAGGGACSVQTRGFLGRLTQGGVTPSVAEPWLERLMRAGLLRLTWRERGRRALEAVAVLEPSGLEELARPGESAAREAALSEAASLLQGLDHPVAAEARLALAEEGRALSPDLARALAAIARHAALGEVLAERVFSARYLGSSKALARLRAGVEQRLGPLESLGVREGGALTLVGGSGRLFVGSATIDLGSIPPYVGLSRDTALALERIEPPPHGLVAVENWAVFEACCRGEVTDLCDSMFVWTAGYPGRGVQAVVEGAARAGAAVRAWCDFDLDGVRIARIVAGWAPGCRFHRMSPDDLARAARALPLAERARRAVERELDTGTGDQLTATLRAILAAGAWVEQEAMLGGEPPPGEREAATLP